MTLDLLLPWPGAGHVHDHRVFRGRHNDRQTDFVFSAKTIHYANRPPLRTVLPGLETFLARSPFASPHGLAQDRPSVAASEPIPIVCPRPPSIEHKPRPPRLHSPEH